MLDRVHREPEATLADFRGRWEDFGDPHRWKSAWQSRWLGTVGHLVGTVARHGSLYKFGVDRETGAIWLMIEPDDGLSVEAEAAIADDKDPRVEFDCVGQLGSGETRGVVLKLSSPVVGALAAVELADLDFARARAFVVKYWEDWLARGARFEVPEPTPSDRGRYWRVTFRYTE